MNTIIWLVAGGLLGWFAYSALRMNAAIGRFAAVTIGAVAGVLGGKQVAPLFSGAELAPGGFSPSALFFAIATAAAILLAAHLISARWR